MTGNAYDKRRSRREVERERRFMGESLAAFHESRECQAADVGGDIREEQGRQDGVSGDAEPIGVEAAEEEGATMTAAPSPSVAQLCGALVDLGRYFSQRSIATNVSAPRVSGDNASCVVRSEAPIGDDLFEHGTLGNLIAVDLVKRPEAIRPMFVGRVGRAESDVELHRYLLCRPAHDGTPPLYQIDFLDLAHPAVVGHSDADDIRTLRLWCSANQVIWCNGCATGLWCARALDACRAAMVQRTTSRKTLFAEVAT